MNDIERKQLKALSNYLRERRNGLLERWRTAVRADPELTTNSGLSRRALDDHIPRLLQDFEQRLRADHAIEAQHVDLAQRDDAAEHGMHRWQQGYDIRETMREWGHLQNVVQCELDAYAAGHKLEPDVMPTARAYLNKLCMDGHCESASRYLRLQQAAAASRVRDLERSLAALQALENERAELLREAAHDLRGTVGVMTNATAMLARTDVDTSQRDHFHGVLQHRIRSMGALLTDLVDLARLEAGQDPPHFEMFDVSERIRDYCEVLRPIAAERGLFLKCEGPSTLPIESDPLKVQRIIQNLMLNALKATERGGVVVQWSRGSGEEVPHWILCIQDTGPGFALQAAGPLRHALKSATEHAHSIEVKSAARAKSDDADTQHAKLLPAGSGSSTAALPSGEGIGLSIVKRLCEVLHATVELETAPERGTTIRITFPLHYSRA